MIFDFHTHTFLSDGVLSPIELIRRAVARGYGAIALTDHVGLSNARPVIEASCRECEAARHWKILALPGVELTHVPAVLINEAARNAREAGARIVAVHGETITEPVEPGTNRSALESDQVDVLAHPGFITEYEASLAAERGIFVEISARKGHSLTNGHIVKICRKVGAQMIVDSDAHEPQDLLTPELVRQVALGAGLAEEELDQVLTQNPLKLLAKLGLAPVRSTEY